MIFNQDLENINWDFDKSWSNFGVHHFHWFPARLIPQISAILITNFSKKGDTILDPFCGGGSTLVEALRLGRKPIGIDILPLACLISEAKTRLIEPKYLEQETMNLLKNMKKTRLSQLSTEKILLPTAIPANRLEEFLDNKSPANIERWFHPATFNEITRIKELIDKEKSIDLKNFFIVCLSDRLKSCCSQKRWGGNWGYIADNVLPTTLTYVDAFAQFQNHVIDMIQGSRQLYDECNKLGVSFKDLQNLCKVYQTDARKMSEKIESESIDLIITSPPYPYSIDYTTANRLSFLLFGWNIDELKRMEIGARWRRNRRDAMSQYIEDIRQSFSQIYGCLKRDAYFAFVFGHLATQQRKSALSAMLNICVKDLGFNLIRTIPRKINYQIIGARSVISEEIVILKK